MEISSNERSRGTTKLNNSSSNKTQRRRGSFFYVLCGLLVVAGGFCFFIGVGAAISSNDATLGIVGSDDTYY
jgi:hypothetical protein